MPAVPRRSAKKDSETVLATEVPLTVFPAPAPVRPASACSCKRPCLESMRQRWPNQPVHEPARIVSTHLNSASYSPASCIIRTWSTTGSAPRAAHRLRALAIAKSIQCTREVSRAWGWRGHRRAWARKTSRHSMKCRSSRFAASPSSEGLQWCKPQHSLELNLGKQVASSF